MAVTVNMHQAKTQLSKLVAKALAGEEIILANRGKPVARIVPIQDDQDRDWLPLGMFAGQVRLELPEAGGPGGQEDECAP